MNGNIRVGNLFGIPFYVNLSWFLVLALVTWDYGGGLASAFPGLGGSLPWLLGLVTALLLFASVLAHELGHSFVALSQGINVNSITLFLFGGLAALEKESDTPRDAFRVAIAGPLVSLGLFAILFTAAQVLPLSGPLAAIVSLLSYINLALGVFNLIPGLPLDGGNVLKSAVWKLTGNPYKGIVFASRVGQFIGWAGIALGVASLLGLSSFGSVWTLLIGLFLLQNANRTAQSGQVQQRLDGLTAEDAIVENGPVVSANISLRDFADDTLLSDNRSWRKFLVVDDNQQLIGTVLVDDLGNMPREEWSDHQVRDIMNTDISLATVNSTQPLLEVIQSLEQKQEKALAVIRENGVLVGLLEKASIQALLQRRYDNPNPA